MANVLMVAYHFPPSGLSSGHLRTLSLARYLPRHDWRALILSAHPRAFSQRDDRLLAEVPDDLPVTRAFALDTRRHLSIRGSYPVLLAQPDRWISWWLGAVPAGLRLIRRHRPALIWSTYPITTAHLIAYTLHRLTGIPWVADFRDPVGTSDLGSSPLTARTRGRIERLTIARAAKTVFTTEGARQDYASRFPGRAASLAVVSNGFDERKFGFLEGSARAAAGRDGPLTLVHSGVLYPQGRDPEPFFQALKLLREKRALPARGLRVVLRASGHDATFMPMIQRFGLEDMVFLESPSGYEDALREQADADGLLLFQGSQFNRQIPAKVYEYLRVGRPIFALTDEHGDTANLLRSEGLDSIAPIDMPAEIVSQLQQFLDNIGAGRLQTAATDRVAYYSREAATGRYAGIFDEVVARQ